MSDNCQNNLFWYDCIKERDRNQIDKLKNIEGKLFKKEILQSNSLIEENIIKMNKIRDIFNENVKSSLNLLDQRIRLIIDEITILLNDRKNKNYAGIWKRINR